MHTYHPLKNLLATAACAAAFTSGARSAEPSVVEKTIEEHVASEHADFRVVQLVSGLEHPWAVAWLPDGRKLISERTGHLNLVSDESVVRLSGLPEIDADEDQKTPPEGGNQGGLLDVVVHPDYEENGWIYFTYSSPGDNDSVIGDDDRGTGTALARARLSEDGTGLTDLEHIYTQIPRRDPGRHYGSRIVFPGDGHVLFTIGDRGLRFPSQDLTDPAGSVIRLKEDGGAPEDNPFVGVAPGNLRPEIFSFGHRNNQGLAINPANGEIWASGHGPKGGDIIYNVRKGKNYGWPQVSYGVDYSTGKHIGIGTSAPGVEPPAWVSGRSQAPSGLAFYHGDVFPEWNGSLFAGFLLAEQVSRFVVEDGKITHEEVLLENKLGRIRDVRQAPDGHLYLLTDAGDGGLFRIEPVDL